MPCNESHTCMNCMKKDYSLLNELNYSELESLDKNRSVANYKKGEVIYKEGSKPMGLLCLNAGKVKIVRTSGKGTEQIVGLKKPVDFIDIRSLVNNADYSDSAIALEDSSVCFIDKNDFMNAVNANPSLSLKIIKMFASELDDADKRFVHMTQKHLRARLAEIILYLLDFYGTFPDGKTINCLLKRSDLAGLSNMTTANVIRTISDFEKERVVISEGKRLKVIDAERLQQVSQGE